MSTRSRLETHAISITATVLGSTPEELVPLLEGSGTATSSDSFARFGIDIQAIIALIESIAQIIATITGNCPQKKGFLASIAKPQFVQRISTRMATARILGRSTYPVLRDKATAVAETLMQYAPRLAAEELGALYEEVQGNDNWI